MKASELMIGDWVAIDEPDKYVGAVGQIKSLLDHKENDAAYFYIFIQGKFGYLLKEVCSDDIRPIPLTSEILEKNGWKSMKNESGDFILTKPMVGNSATITKTINGYEMSHGAFNGLGIHYIHQLQHALKLCGIDKTIEL